jgi:hypothetical protein
MLRITTRMNSGSHVCRLEGRLYGPWVDVLDECWRSTLLPAAATGNRVVVDLTGTTFIDAAGKACLAEMHRHGAVFIAGDPVTKAVVAEINAQHEVEALPKNSEARNVKR